MVRYEGELVSGSKFDGSIAYTWLQLPNTVRGFANGVAKLKTGTDLVTNNDGTAFYTDSGVGLFFFPSGLSYFLGRGPTGQLPQYVPLIFQLELGNFVENTDADNDGIPSIQEDLNGNGYMFDDNTDLNIEENNFAGFSSNFQDPDDDGDGVPTRTEISDADGNIIIPYPDSNNDGTPDYLDVDVLRDPTTGN